MAELLEHQREALAVARACNVLASGARPVGRTLLAAMRVREWLLERHDARPLAVALAPTQDARDALLQELARLVSEPVWKQQAQQAESDAVQALAEHVGSKRASHVAVVSPKLFQAALRKSALHMSQIGLLVLEHADEIHQTAPSLYRQAFESVPLAGEGAAQLRIFATSRTAVSALDMDANRNPLYRHIQVLSISPILAPSDVMVLSGAAPPRQPLLLSETFDHTASPPDDSRLKCDVRDFLLGENEKKVDLVGVFRVELELGNSAAVYDEKKKQDRVNRFIQDAQSVYQHLGLWCLLKFVELELQSNLHACLVDDVDNINQRRRRAKLEEQQRLLEGKQRPDADVEADSDDEIGDDENDREDDGLVAEDTLAAFIENSKDLNEAKLTKVKPILKVLKWLAGAATSVGVQAASPRLMKVAETVKNRLLIQKKEDAVHVAPRCWVFLERRAHCTVVAEYLTATLAGIGSPPCCSMLGHSNARIVGALHFSSYLKVVTMFTKRETHVIVSTSLAKSSQRVRKQPPLCDLVVVMDELLEADKLLDYCSRVCPRGGVVKYLLPQSPGDTKKYNVLLHKFKELALLEQPASDLAARQPTQQPEHVSIELAAGSGVFKPTVVPVPSLNIPRQSSSPAKDPFVPAIPVRAVPTPKYEVVHKDTGAVLNLSNSVEILSKFCDTLPGLDTYDRRPQYSIKRHQIGGTTMSAAMKQMKKKKQKFNSKLDDKIDDIVAAAEAREGTEGQEVDMEPTSAEMQPPRFLYTAKLQLPRMLRGKKVFDSPKVSSDVEAKAIVAFEGCKELVKGGLLDRSFRSALEVDESTRPPASSANEQSDDKKTDAHETVLSEERLKDMSTQNSYDLPPVSAADLGLPTVRSLLCNEQARDGDPEQVVSMCFYGIEGVRFAILSTKELYTGNTNTGWRYDFATSDVMEPVVHKVTLQTKPLRLKLTRRELQEALHFHLMTMRLACMHVDDAMREVDIKGDKVWNEFSEQNDKGYLVVPSRSTDCQTGQIDLDWSYLREIISKPLLVSCWPLPPASEWPSDEWVCVPTYRRNVCYVVRSITDKTAGEAVKPLADDDEAWKNHYKTKSVTGVPIFGRWHTRDQVKAADPEQPLIHGVQVPPIVPLIRRVMQRNHEEATIAQSKTKFDERYLLPQYTSLLRLTKTRYFEAMGIVPLLYEFERKCQMSNLMTTINLELDLTLLDHATTKPLYERLEILGDTFLKLETSWFLFENRRDISEEGFLTQLRRDIIRNDRLNMFALAKQLHHYMLYPAEIEQHPFKFWKPSCMGKTPESIVAPSKWIADVLEAICGAYLVGHGEVGARHFLEWVGVKVPAAPHVFANQYYPDCFPNEVTPNESAAVALARQKQLGFRVDRFDSVLTQLVAMQQRLKYTFNNKLLLLEAMTHPSVGELRIISDKTDKATMWRGNYERLEYLGDAVVEYLTLSYAFTNYQNWLPGSLTQWKSATVSNDALGKTAIVCFGVDECILSGALKIDRETLELVQSFERRYPRDKALTVVAANAHHVVSQRQKRRAPSATAVNAMALPKVFADVFEALVAAVFLDSGHKLQTVRDVFLGPLLAIVGDDAYAYVCRESGLPLDSAGVGEDFDMEELRLLSDDEDF